MKHSKYKSNSTLYCPMTRRIMRDPVICADGYTYERRTIEGWLNNFEVSPMTGEFLINKTLRPNIRIAQMISMLYSKDLKATSSSAVQFNANQPTANQPTANQSNANQPNAAQPNTSQLDLYPQIPPLDIGPPMVPINKYSNYMLVNIVQ
jgi:hypothetical protein